MGTTTLTRVVSFRAVHHYHRPQWSEAENRRVFGALVEQHGHDYRCAVTIAGPLSSAGMVVDLGHLDQVLAKIVGPLDGGDLNRDLPPCAAGTQLPTCEVIASWLASRIAPALPAPARLVHLRLEEDPTLYAEWNADD